MAHRSFGLQRPVERVLDLPRSAAGRTELAYALVFPNLYTLGMANLGFQTVLAILSGLPGASCHRVFLDHPSTLESDRALRDYDVVALSLSFEGDYPNALKLLAGGGVPVRSTARGAKDPLVVAGGVGVTLNPEPLAAFLDVVFLGEAEAGLPVLHQFLLDHRGLERPDLLEALADARLPGVYVPSRYVVEEGSGTVLARRALGGAPERVERRWAPLPWEPAHTRIAVAQDAFGGAYLLEVSRGCPHGCRFCAAGYATRPVRFLPLESLLRFVDAGASAAGRLGFVGAAVSDHPDFRELARQTLSRGAGFTVSSFRAENLDEEVIALLSQGGLKTLTVALEAGTERLRTALGKGLGRGELLQAARLASKASFDGLRIYGMVGLPGEEEEDIRALADLAIEAREALGRGTVTLSVAPFVPKPHTPLQWETMASEAVLRVRIRLLESLLGRKRGVKAVAEAPRWSRVQGLLSRGGRSIGPLLEGAAEDGNWRRVLRSPAAAAVLDVPRAPADVLPWDFVSGGPSRSHLVQERDRAKATARVSPCGEEDCTICGVCGGG